MPIFFLKLFASTLYFVLYVYTAELYPTRIRNFSLGLTSSCGRLGAFAAPLVGQHLIDHTSGLGTFLPFVGVQCVAAGLALALPFETLGRNPDAVPEELSETTKLIGPRSPRKGPPAA